MDQRRIASSCAHRLDIGKIHTVGAVRRPPLHNIVRHEIHNLLVLASHLEWLRQQDMRLHAGLVYILDYLATPAAARARPRYFPAEVVAQFDQWSAAAFSARNLSALTKAGTRAANRAAMIAGDRQARC